ncbi:prepilin peptidase [Ruminiclostridium herbifermentans]|uniref:Prepilin peptidase n=1 Tax=Ruminiclostridium herbifermentans TaxID=2488810 RepID=A0A4V6ENN4_9FIRM|nr:A24 family peptidase [Ruminiclostridium herbifermentans]QNU65685.1 prepilin peptidase [Ruminiclostridium herbifermentans]
MVKYIILICLLIFSIISDIKYSKIRNVCVMPAAISGLLINTFEDGTQGFKSSLFGLLVPILLLGFLFYFELIGAGDIKLFSAIGALFGCEFILYGMAYSFIIAGILSALRLIQNKKVQAGNTAVYRSIESVICNLYSNIKTCCLTSSLCFLSSGKRHFIKLSPYIAMGIGLQVIITYF